jgi:uncharacterized Zn finger protein (UPF0148 family)
MMRALCAAGCGREVRAIYCPSCRELRSQREAEAREAAAQAARERLSNPQFQARLQAARRKESDQ